MRLFRIAVVLLFSSLALVQARAADPTLDEKIRYLLQGLDQAQDDQATFDQLAATMKKSFQNVPPAAVDRMMVIMREEYDKTFSDRLVIYIDVYKAVYTEDEIESLYEFFSTPSGAKIIAKNGDIVKELRAASMERMGQFYKNFMQQMLDDPELKQLKSKTPKDL